MGDGSMFAPLMVGDQADGAASVARAAPPTDNWVLNSGPGAAQPDFHHKKFGFPSGIWEYRDALGDLEGYVCRFDGPSGKVFLPRRYGDLNGRTGWHWKGWKNRRPLYRLSDVISKIDADVLIVEGEGTAEAAAKLFPTMAIASSMGGAGSPHKTDFSPLAGRRVVISPDNDDAGTKYGDTVYTLLCKAGAAEILYLPPNRLGDWMWNNEKRQRRNATLKQGWDLADALVEGWTAERIQTLSAETNLFVPYHAADVCPQDRSNVCPGDIGANAPDGVSIPPPQFVLRHHPATDTPAGVYRLVERTEKEQDRGSHQRQEEWKWICSPLEVIAATRNRDGEDWGRLLRITDSDGRSKEWSMPMEMLAGNGEEYRRRLLSLGLAIDSSASAKRHLNEYIQMTRTAKRVLCVPHVGWHSHAGRTLFVLPDATYGVVVDEELRLQSTGLPSHHFQTSGSIEEWKHDVASSCVGNSRLAFAVSAAFAAVLLEPAGEPSGGIHFVGPSKIAKTLIAVIAGSVWGGGGVNGFVRTRRSTSNGLEGVAVTHCDGLLCLDELGQVDAREAGEIAYMLANGRGKQRAGKHGQARPTAEWRVLFLSTGEVSLADKMAEAGIRAKPGQEVRLADIPADAGANLGVFDTIRDATSFHKLAGRLYGAAAKFYGTPIRIFLERLTALIANDRPGLRSILAETQEEFISEHVSTGASEQVVSVASRFALIGAGGELATELGITGWPPGEALRAATSCYRAWLDQRGSTADREIETGISEVRTFLELHGSYCFETPWEPARLDGVGKPLEQRVPNRAGFKRRRSPDGPWEYFVPAETWRSEICKGLDPKLIARDLAARGLLVPGNDGRMAVSVYVPG